ncbi:siderophore-interacting protein [Flavobacterium sp. NKUCC04_CG]|uniref:siderophore-interacting protein n=1 Tax=Flavobacterium sp. NKUCC04_CG TaxID=2842121 RepID=UPI001C5A84A2|nr:siderophore-interacting protein [Flavobacterium sp. NKUCC04_CG]MBW3520387.1 siderophore-interacting protein [Flavobacterium sp. NKUCC04_CG]
MAVKTDLIARVFYLKNRTYLTPNYIRITLENEFVSEYKNTTIGVNNKIFIAPDGLDKVYLPEFDSEKMDWIPVAAELTPLRRTYTHRGINLEKNEIYIDFVAHGDEGPASAWAIHAPIGAELGVVMRKEPQTLYEKADWYLLVGDATAIPVLGAILEDLPKTARGIAFIEVETVEDIQQLETGSQVEIKWLINPTPGENSMLTTEVEQIVKDLSEASKFAYVAAEFTSVKEIRTLLRKEHQWTAAELQAYSYWKHGKSETSSETDRRAERAAIT